MDTDVQKSLVEFIQHITDNPEIVFDIPNTGAGRVYS